MHISNSLSHRRTVYCATHWSNISSTRSSRREHDGILSLVQTYPPYYHTPSHNLAHHTSMAERGHLGQRQMYNMLRRTYYWPHKADNVYTTIAKWKGCAQSGCFYLHKLPLHLFLASGPLDFIAMEMIGPSLETKQGKQYICVKTHWYSKLARAILTSRDIIFANFDHITRSMDYRIRHSHLHTDEQRTAIWKCFTLVCGCLDVNHLTTTAYPPQFNGQAERFIRIIVARVRSHVAEHQVD